MFALVVRIYHVVRVVGTAFAVAGTLGRMLGGSMTEVLPIGLRPIALDLWHAITSWPVYAVSLLLAGAWLQDWFDARMRTIEGRPSWFGIQRCAPVCCSRAGWWEDSGCMPTSSRSVASWKGQTLR